MLVLSRKLGESIVINGGVTVYVIEVRGKVVRLGIDAPKAIPIRRSECDGRIPEDGRTFAAKKKS